MVRSNGISDNSVCASRRQACSTRPGVFEDVAFLPNSVAESCFSTWIKGISARDPGVFVTRAWGNSWPATTEIYRPSYAGGSVVSSLASSFCIRPVSTESGP